MKICLNGIASIATYIYEFLIYFFINVFIYQPSPFINRYTEVDKLDL